MRPFTRIISGVAIVLIVALVAVFVRLSRKIIGPADPGVSDDVITDSIDARSAPATVQISPNTALSFPNTSGRSIPRFEPDVLSGEVVRAKLREESRKDGFLFREAETSKVFVVQNGTKFHVPNMQEFMQMGLSWDDVREVTPGVLDLPEKPPDKTLFRERDDPRVYYFENGQKRWVTNHAAVNTIGRQWADIKVVPKGTLGGFADGVPVR